jgi:outer membrane protein assembly factor BamB
MPDHVPSSLSRVWTLAGGGPGRTGLSPHRRNVNSRPARTLTAGGGIQSAVVFDAGRRAFVADMSGKVQAFGADDPQLWEQILEGAVSATPAVDPDAGRLFVGGHAGWLYSLNTGDGKVCWRSRLPSTSDPRIVADLLFLRGPALVVASSWGGQFHVLDAESGKILRAWDAGISPQAPASADARNNIYQVRAVWDEGISLVRVTPDGSQTVLHRSPEGERRANRSVLTAAPVVDDERNRLFFIANGDRMGMVHAWDLAMDKLEWSVEFERAVVATPALRPDGVLMVADMTGKLSAVHAGKIRFRYDTGCDYLLAGPVCDGLSQTYLGDPTGFVHRVDAEGNGQVLFEAGRSLQARPSWDPEGSLYVASMDGRVHVFRHGGE